MHYTTKVINIAGEECSHYMVIDSQTICGIQLENIQTRLKYTLDESKLCEKCRDKSPVPRLKDWCPRYQIKNGEHAKSALSTLYLFYQSLDEQVQLGWGVWEYGNNGYCVITNFLVNPDPQIEDVIEAKKVLKVSFIGGEGRLNEILPFGLIEEFMPLIRRDFLEELREN